MIQIFLEVFFLELLEKPRSGGEVDFANFLDELTFVHGGFNFC